MRGPIDSEAGKRIIREGNVPMATEDIVARLDSIDVRAPREFSHTVPEWAKENGRIDWRVRNTENMKKMAAGEVTPIYQK